MYYVVDEESIGDRYRFDSGSIPYRYGINTESLEESRSVSLITRRITDHGAYHESKITKRIYSTTYRFQFDVEEVYVALV